ADSGASGTMKPKVRGSHIPPRRGVAGAAAAGAADGAGSALAADAAGSSLRTAGSPAAMRSGQTSSVTRAAASRRKKSTVSHGSVNVSGSSILMRFSRRPSGSTRSRWVSTISSERGNPDASTTATSDKPTVRITSVSPSQRPTGNPAVNGNGGSTSTPARFTTRYQRYQ